MVLLEGSEVHKTNLNADSYMYCDYLMIIAQDNYSNFWICLIKDVQCEYSWVYILDPEMDSYAVYTHWLKNKGNVEQNTQ